METPTINDLMVPISEYASVSGEATLAEALEALDKARERKNFRRFKHRAVLIRDDREQIVGKVRHIEVIQHLEPGYQSLGDLDRDARKTLTPDKIRSMIQEHNLWLTPLADICRRAAVLQVRKIMHTFTENEFVDIDTPLVQAIHQMVVGHFLSLLVTRNGEVVGVLRLTDIFSEIYGIIKDVHTDQ